MVLKGYRDLGVWQKTILQPEAGVGDRVMVLKGYRDLGVWQKTILHPLTPDPYPLTPDPWPTERG